MQQSRNAPETLSLPISELKQCMRQVEEAGPLHLETQARQQEVGQVSQKSRVIRHALQPLQNQACHRPRLFQELFPIASGEGLPFLYSCGLRATVSGAPLGRSLRI